MEIIHPNEIGTKISTLIADSTQFFYAVSPYVKIRYWNKVLVNLERARSRGVTVKLFYREMDELDQRKLLSLGVELHLIDRLHTKLYLNDDAVIVSSMNWYEYSDVNSIDLALHYNDQENYAKLFNYFEKYILSQIQLDDQIQTEPQTITEKTDDLTEATADDLATWETDDLTNEVRPINELRELSDFLNRRFPKSRLKLRENYIFSEYFITPFETMINTHFITLKVPNGRTSIDKINYLKPKFDGANKLFLAELHPPTPKYRYATWKIAIERYSHQQIAKVIDYLLEIEFVTDRKAFRKL